jgi:cell division FtsZ-interacting protein ZapD
MTEMVQFSFALSPRMRSFIELRDALACLESARQSGRSIAWLHAACDLHDSMLGDQGRKNVIPEITSLLLDMQSYLKNLCDEAPKYRERIDQACDGITSQIQLLQSGLPDATNYLAKDALINAYLNTQKKHDWLGHKLCMQQSVKAIWENSETRIQPLHTALAPLSAAVNTLDGMFNDFVRWQQCMATGGTGHITPERGTSCGLLVIGIPKEAVSNGLIPDISGNKLAIRLRFQLWNPGQAPQDVCEDQPYAKMLVPVGA